MKYNIKNISIPEPCTQNWADMRVVEQGRFCQSCQKTVVDFTRLSDEEILQYLSSAGNTCAKITPLQLRMLNASITIPQPARISWRKYSMAAVAVWILSLFRPEAKAITPKIIQHQTVEVKKAGVTTMMADDQIAITGKIVDENNEPLPGVIIKIKGTDKSAVTTTDGIFKIEVPMVSKVKLMVSFIGYETKEVKIRPKRKNEKIDLKLKLTAAFLGGLAVVYSVKTPTT